MSAPNHVSADLAHLVHPLTDHSRLPVTGPLVITRGEGSELAAEGGQRPGFTHSGHPVACAVALATIAAIEREDLLVAVRERSETLARLIDPLRSHPEVGEVRQAGLMVGVELVADKATRQRWPAKAERGRRVATEARGRGLLTRSLLDDILCLAPPFTISDELLGRTVEILGDSIAATEDLPPA
jgi:adenosylmethionine-8-amino-7-oxononanoate aminotransferase